MTDPYRNPSPKLEPVEEDTSSRDNEARKLIESIHWNASAASAVRIATSALRLIAYECMDYYKFIAVERERNASKRHDELMTSLKKINEELKWK